MFDSVNLSKFLVPNKQKGFLHRARLIDWMHENVHRKLTFVSAPAGFGKTSLLLDFARDVDACVAWLLVTPEDRDLRRFAWDLIMSVRQVFPEFGVELESTLRTSQGELDPISLAVDFVNEALTSINDYCLLFIDDYHLVAESEEVTGFFELFLDYLPDGIRLIVASRTEYGIPAGKLYARNEINLLNVDQLRFQPDELQQLIARAYRVKLTRKQARDLAERSDGWIVAIMLAARTLKGGTFPEFQGSKDHVFAFLAQEVIERESDTLQQFMLAMSILDEFNIESAKRLSGKESADQLILELEQRNLFISHVETNEGTSYRFHQLFLEFLRHRLSVSQNAWMQELHRLAAAWYEERGDLEKAIQHYLEVGDRASASRLMDTVAKRFFVSGENEQVREWLDILSQPPDMRAAAPELILNRAKYLVDQNNLLEAAHLLEIAEKEFKRQGNTDKILNGLSVRGQIYLQRGDFEAALGVVEQAREILAGEITGDLYLGRGHQFDRIEGLYHLWQGRTQQAFPILKQVVSDLKALIERVESRSMKVQLTHDLVLNLDILGLAHYQSGKLYDGQTFFLEALKYRERYTHNNQAIVFSLNNIGYVYYQIGELDQAYQYLTQASHAAEKLGKGQAHIHLNNSWADFLRAIDELDAAERKLKEALKIGEDARQHRKELDNSGTYLSYAALERARGNFDKAIYYLHEAYRLRNQAPDTPEFQTELGAIYLGMGQSELAEKTLRKAVSAFPANKPMEAHARATFLLARTMNKRGRREEAWALLQSALAQSAELGYDQFLISEGRLCETFLTTAAQELPDLEQLKSVLRRIQSFSTGLTQFEAPAETSLAREEKIWLEVCAFGSGKLSINGEQVRKSDWRATMAKNLFFYILDSGGDTGANIKLNFWPEKPGPKATSNFQSTLWRARQALKGLNVLVLEDSRYCLAPEVVLWYDVSEFENLIARAEQNEISESEKAGLLESAVELYTGDFLDENFMEWAHTRRLELQRMFRDALETLGMLASKRGRYEDATRYYEKLLQVDPFRDDIQIAMMDCLVKSGAVMSASQRYQTYTRFLAAEGLEPSSELRNYYSAMMQQG